MKYTIFKYISLTAVSVILLFTSGACQANTPTKTQRLVSSMDYSDSVDLQFYLVREDELVGVISAIQSSESFKQLTFSELDKKSGEVYLVACVNNNLDKRVRGSGSVTFTKYPKEKGTVINFISIPANAKKNITVVPLGMPALPLFSEETPVFSWKWDSITAK